MRNKFNITNAEYVVTKTLVNISAKVEQTFSNVHCENLGHECRLNNVYDTHL